MSGPLDGLRVLDLATIIAGPFAATLLADYGADVLKVELPGVGDGARNFGPFRDGKSLWWKVINRDKKFMTLDMRKPEGVALVKKLLTRFDVVVENFRPGLPRSGGYWGYTSRWCCFGADRHAEALGGDGRLTCSPVINSEGPSRDDCNPR